MQAVKAIANQFPMANATTADQALKNNQQQVDFIKKFLEIAGLLALLIGGVGIVNTMQVLFSRRKIEIAMLKTTGYRRLDLYLFWSGGGLVGSGWWHSWGGSGDRRELSGAQHRAAGFPDHHPILP